MIENTSKRDPLLHLAGAWGDSSRYITEMESAGQAQLVNSDRLPVEAKPNDDAYTALGFAFEKPDGDDALFRSATIPSGWKRVPSDHSMWSHLVDGLGRRRVAIFYKAAFYDRRAFMRLESPSSYLRTTLYENATPVLDDEWLTVEVAVQELEALRDESIDEAAKCDEYALRDSTDTYWRDRAGEHRADAAKATAAIKAVSR